MCVCVSVLESETPSVAGSWLDVCMCDGLCGGVWVCVSVAVSDGHL